MRSAASSLFAPSAISHAARRCSVAQPSLTHAIKLLEKELGGPLFVRGSRQSRLSALGLAVRRHLAQIDRCASQVRQKADELLAARSQIVPRDGGGPAHNHLRSARDPHRPMFGRTIPPATASPSPASRATIDPSALLSTFIRDGCRLKKRRRIERRIFGRAAADFYACAPPVEKRRAAMPSSSACSRAFASAFSRA